MEPPTNAQQEIKKVIYVIDHDPKMRQRINDIFASENVDVKTFPSDEDFLASPPSNKPGCLILGAGLTGSSAVDLMHEIKSRQISLPFIVLGDEDDIPQAVSVIRAGAVDFITKPFADHKLRRTCMKRLQESKL